MEARFASHMPSNCTEGTDEGERILGRTWLVSPRCDVVFGNTRLRGKRSAIVSGPQLMYWRVRQPCPKRCQMRHSRGVHLWWYVMITHPSFSPFHSGPHLRRQHC
ncbi:hypothetical protein TNCV_3020041 [Trichonephila clavipes]|nr:hypothetical protein TNCV_3020041 [Trichonephila clavipes]